MKAKFTIEAIKENNTYKVVINGSHIFEIVASSAYELILFLVARQLAATMEMQIDMQYRGGGTCYLEFLPDCYDDPVE